MLEFELHSKFANKSYVSLKSRKPAFGSGKFSRPSRPAVFRRVGHRNTHPKKEGYRKQNWFKRIHPKKGGSRLAEPVSL